MLRDREVVYDGYGDVEDVTYVERKCFQEFACMVVVSRACDVVVVRIRLNTLNVAGQRCDVRSTLPGEVRVVVFE